jgi:hypothetical protein
MIEQKVSHLRQDGPLTNTEESSVETALGDGVRPYLCRWFGCKLVDKHETSYEEGDSNQKEWAR